ncbi:MAG: glycoside hydrolase family 16 protein [Melioribacteraceae bacterium]|nr:glycoside hydrolase family 16 protein [Melioribacteraceae bacterium]MCF8356654.1 glycoside hydrolase family 16 protein [Melioribacteraceae bacterium]MCF8393878.1 glycoside hydrolase family 16 protein [Melioribacteraceae bacterium]
MIMIYKNILKPIALISLSMFFLFAKCSEDETPPTQNGDQNQLPEREGYTLIWNDEFEGTEIDDTKWEHEVNASGGGNNELQYYTDRRENSYVDSGKLNIVALRETYTASGTTRDYTSARMRTANNGDWKYVRIDVRAKIPYGQGMWPAIWMLPTDWEYGGWPASGEIDIMEHVGYDPGKVHGSVHTEAYNHRIGTQKSAQTIVPDANENFHIYSVEWTKDSIEVFVDEKKYFSFLNDNEGNYKTWPFDKRFHLLLNVAVGGDWPGAPDETTKFPKIMEVDYVRVFQRTE